MFLSRIAILKSDLNQDDIEVTVYCTNVHIQIFGQEVEYDE